MLDRDEGWAGVANAWHSLGGEMRYGESVAYEVGCTRGRGAVGRYRWSLGNNIGVSVDEGPSALFRWG